MLTGERRGSSARRGMTVLGKIPAVPKPINLPSQRLENRGLDPNVEIVPRGSLSWGSAGRSPPTSNSPWGNLAPASSPPNSSGAWGPKLGATATGNSGTGGGTASGGPGIAPRPSSGGSGTRPSSADSLGQTQRSPDLFPSNTNSSSAWGARPSSASGVLGQAQSHTSSPLDRPRSADTSRPTRNLSQFGDSVTNASPPSNAAWAGPGTPRRLGEEPHQVSRFQLTRTDFPTLGSEKNPDLRPQHSSSIADRGAAAEGKLAGPEERQAPTPPGTQEDLPPLPPTGGYGNQDRGAPDTWRREPAPFQGPPPIAEGNWHRDGPHPRPSYGGQVPQPENWRRDTPPSGGPADDNWRRGGGPPVGQYGPPPGPGHYPHEGPGFMHQPRFGPGPAPYGRGVPGPGGYGHHGDMYGNAGPLLRPTGPMHPIRPNMFQGPVPYDGFYGPPAYQQGMEESDRRMMGIGGGPYGGYPQHRGPPPEAFGRFPHGVMNQGPRHQPNSNLRERNEPLGEGYHDGPNYHKEAGGPEGPSHKDGRGYSERYTGGPALGHDIGDSRRGGPSRPSTNVADVHRHPHRGASSGHHVGHRDWGAAASSDEPMDFSKPVFEEEISSVSPNVSGKQSPAPVESEEISVEEVKREDTVKMDSKNDKSIVDVEVVKDEEEMKVVVVPKAEAMLPSKSGDHLSTSKSKNDDVVELPELREQTDKKILFVVDKEVLAKVVTKEGPTKWERGSKRADNHVREVIGPAVSSVGTPSVRSGPNNIGKSSILGNAPRSTINDVSATPQVLPSLSQEKLAAIVAPPVSETESLKAVEKIRTPRRSGESGPDSSGNDLTSRDSVVSDVSAGQTPIVHEGNGKEGLKLKGRASSHDGEKEWRPKVPLAEASPRSLTATPQVSRPVVAAPASTLDSVDNATVESENAPQPDSYDYDLQRAKMKEIAAQRARQLQKEEEERIKEQKAKARAKLEELDRRSTVLQPLMSEESPLETLKVVDDVEEAALVEESSPVETGQVLETGSSIGNSRRSGRNEHGKRERDRKPNGRKVGAGETQKGKGNGIVSQPPPILPSPSVTAAPLLSTPVSMPEVYSQPSNAQQQNRHKGRPEKKQLVARPDDADRSMPTSTLPLDTSSGVNGGWNIGAPASQETDSVSLRHSTTGTTEGMGAFRKNKSGRSSRNRPQQGASAVPGEGIQFGDVIPGLHTSGSSGSDFPVDLVVLPPELTASLSNVSLSNVSLSGDALTGDEGSAVSTNGDVPSKRVQRKSRGARRPARGDRGSQDVRVAEKAHTSDSMVWAPVRSPRAGGSSKVEGMDTHSNEQQKEETSAAQQQARAKRAELERYTPKPVMKHQETLEQHPVLPHRQNSASSPALPIPVVAAESPPVFSVSEVKQLSSTNAKSNHEPKQVDVRSKSGRAPGSWRQRGSGSDRGSENVKDVPSSLHSSGPDSGHQHGRFDQKSAGGQPVSRRNQHHSEHPHTTPQSAPVAPAPAQVPEKEQVTHQKPYQPPRPASASAPRGHGSQYSEGKGHDQGAAPHSRHSGAPSDRPLPSENTGSHQHSRTGGGHHPRQQGFEREQAPSQQVYGGPHSQLKSQPAASNKELGQTVSRDRENLQQQPSRGNVQHPDGGEQGSHQRGRYERDQAGRSSAASQRGPGHWQQTGAQEGFRSAPARPHSTERDLPVTTQFSRMDITKQQAADSHRPHQLQSSGQQQQKASQQTAPVPIPSTKVDSGHWGGEGGSPPVLRGRDQNHGRRGRFGGRQGPRNTEMEHRRDPPVTKQRLVIDATGGAVPSQVGV